MRLCFGTGSCAQATIASFHRADQPSAHAATVRLSNAARHLIAFRNKVAGASLRAARIPTVEIGIREYRAAWDERVGQDAAH